jgi:hypothetical protein
MTHAVDKENKTFVDGDKEAFTAGKEIGNTVQ